MTFDFKEQLEIGEQGEGKLDDYFAKFYDIHVVPMSLQKLGVDRIFIARKDGSRFTVEYKTDFRSIETGNIFLEFEVNKKPGWVYTSVAQVLVYYAPPKAYLINMYNLRQDYQKKLIEGPPSSKVLNDGFYALGTLFPLKRLQFPVLIGVVNIWSSSYIFVLVE